MTARSGPATSLLACIAAVAACLGAGPAGAAAQSSPPLAAQPASSTVNADQSCPAPDPALKDAMARLAALQKQAAEHQAKDFGNLCKYRDENAAVLASGTRPEVIFLGDSITENWKLGDPGLFSAKVLDRGIGGQTTPQILLRVYPDVVALHPRVVHILAGTNDVSGKTGPDTDTTILGNIAAMIDIAKAHGIAVVLSAITPTTGYSMRPGFNPWPRIVGLNRELARLAHERGITFVDYGPVLDAGDGSLKAALGNDGLHPNREGYRLMRPLAEKALAQATP